MSAGGFRLYFVTYTFNTSRLIALVIHLVRKHIH